MTNFEQPKSSMIPYQTEDARTRNIFAEGELAEESVIRKFRITR